MLSNSFTKEDICLDAKAKTPEEAIRETGKLLLARGKIKEAYIDSMIDTFHSFGPYMVIAPGIAIPHGRPGELVNEDCICFCRLQEPICFGNRDNDPVSYLFGIGSHESNGHLEILRDLSTFLMNKNNVDQLAVIKTKDEFLELIRKGGKGIEGS